ncbi:MAG: MFS transporter [Spirochaetaceae bacterium]
MKDIDNESRRGRITAGRARGYVVVAASFVVQGTIVGALFSYSVFFDALQVEFGWSRAVISGAASAALLALGVWAMVLGSLNDRLGPRAILSVAAVAMTVGYALMSRIQTPAHLYLAYALIVGLAFGAHDVITLSTVARWFERQRGRMSGIVKTGTATGQVVAPALVAMLIAGKGWRSAFLGIALVAGPIVAIAAQLMRLPQERTQQETGAAEGKGGATDGDLRSDAAGTTRVKAGMGGATATMATPAFRWLAAAQLSVFFCMPTVIVHIVPYGTDMGLDRALAAGVLSAIGAASAVGRLTAGDLIDRFGARRTLLMCYSVMLISFVLLQLVYTPVLLYAFALLYGLAHGGTFTSVSPLVAELFGTRMHGRLYGTAVFIGTVAGAVGPVVAGGVYDAFGTYRPVFMFLIALLSFGIFAMRRLAAFDLYETS